jgi:hypothetical protein
MRMRTRACGLPFIGARHASRTPACLVLRPVRGGVRLENISSAAENLCAAAGPTPVRRLPRVTIAALAVHLSDAWPREHEQHSMARRESLQARPRMSSTVWPNKVSTWSCPWLGAFRSRNWFLRCGTTADGTTTCRCSRAIWPTTPLWPWFHSCFVVPVLRSVRPSRPARAFLVEVWEKVGVTPAGHSVPNLR